MGYTKTKFEKCLSETGEIGYVTETFGCLVFANGLPSCFINEVVIFESGDMGQIYAIEEDYIQIIVLSLTDIEVGERVVRSSTGFEINMGIELLGRAVNGLGEVRDGNQAKFKSTIKSLIDHLPQGFSDREAITEPLNTGVAIVDLAIPLGKGQRELVIGDKKTGKTSFLLQCVLNQAREGTFCVYASIGKKTRDVASVWNFLVTNKIEKQCVVVSSYAYEAPGVIYMTPYTAMTIAEFLRDRGANVLLILDDLTTHAKFYRQISLMARRFPGRNSYPPDIFHVHSRLLERAGKFKKSSISVLAVADTVLGDLSSYIQTNLMSITDGHLFFDISLFNAGRRPAINPYLSVTRVGEQAQTQLVRELSRKLFSFLVHIQRLNQLSHFGAEFEQKAQQDIATGEKIFSFFSQTKDRIYPLNLDILVFGGIYSQTWINATLDEFNVDLNKLFNTYLTDQGYRASVDGLIKTKTSFAELISFFELDKRLFFK